MVGSSDNSDVQHYPVLTALRTNSLSLECRSSHEVISLCLARFHFTVSLMHDRLRAGHKGCVCVTSPRTCAGRLVFVLPPLCRIWGALVGNSWSCACSVLVLQELMARLHETNC